MIANLAILVAFCVCFGCLIVLRCYDGEWKEVEHGETVWVWKRQEAWYQPLLQLLSLLVLVAIHLAVLAVIFRVCKG
jgi:hypothetical protein